MTKQLSQANYLDLSVIISNKNRLHTKLYEKRHFFTRSRTKAGLQVQVLVLKYLKLSLLFQHNRTKESYDTNLIAIIK